MKKYVILFCISLFSTIGFTQAEKIDSLLVVIENEKQDTTRVLQLAELSRLYRFTKPDVGIMYAQKGLDMAQTLQYAKGEATCLNALGHNYRFTGNYTKSMKYHFEALQVSENLNYPLGIALSYHGISANYEDQGDYKESLIYAYKVKAIEEAIQYTEGLAAIQGNMGNNYEKLGQLDSALKYQQIAYELSINIPNAARGLIMGRLGNIHAKLGQYDLAFSFYRMGITTAIASSDNNALNEILFGITKLFHKLNNTDSSILYARKALEAGQAFGNPENVINACVLLTLIYKGNGKMDSAFKYMEVATFTKDTLLSQDKVKQVQTLTFEEQNRQREKENEERLAKEERKHNIQNAAIAIGLISFLILFFLLSQSIIINAKLVKFFGILALLMVFEFANLLIHPYLAQWTHHSPVLMLMALVGIGAMLVPLHHRIEKWVTEKMVAKNNKIRLSAAKKTIESLEGKKDVQIY
jgi:tetratricopeptide (TPR) repeat protein